jgi:hypothetical protein
VSINFERFIFISSMAVLNIIFATYLDVIKVLKCNNGKLNRDNFFFQTAIFLESSLVGKEALPGLSHYESAGLEKM